MSVERRLNRDGKFKKAKLDKTSRRREHLAAERDQADPGSNARKNDLLPELEIRQVPIDDLRPSPHRTRRTTPEHIERLMESIATFGFTQPVLVCDGEIIDGHALVEAARKLGLATVPTVEISHLSKVEIRALRQPAGRGRTTATPSSTATIPRVIITVRARVLGSAMMSPVAGFCQVASSTRAKVKCAPAWLCNSSASNSASARMPSPSAITSMRPRLRLRDTAPMKSCCSSASALPAIRS